MGTTASPTFAPSTRTGRSPRGAADGGRDHRSQQPGTVMYSMRGRRQGATSLLGPTMSMWPTTGRVLGIGESLRRSWGSPRASDNVGGTCRCQEASEARPAWRCPWSATHGGVGARRARSVLSVARGCGGARPHGRGARAAPGQASTRMRWRSASVWEVLRGDRSNTADVGGRQWSPGRDLTGGLPAVTSPSIPASSPIGYVCARRVGAQALLDPAVASPASRGRPSRGPVCGDDPRGQVQEPLPPGGTGPSRPGR
jgi:hypothetical protein